MPNELIQGTYIKTNEALVYHIIKFILTARHPGGCISRDKAASIKRLRSILLKDQYQFTPIKNVSLYSPNNKSYKVIDACIGENFLTANLLSSV